MQQKGLVKTMTNETLDSALVGKDVMVQLNQPVVVPYVFEDDKTGTNVLMLSKDQPLPSTFVRGTIVGWNDHGIVVDAPFPDRNAGGSKGMVVVPWSNVRCVAEMTVVPRPTIVSSSMAPGSPLILPK